MTILDKSGSSNRAMGAEWGRTINGVCLKPKLARIVRLMGICLGPELVGVVRLMGLV